MERAVAKLASQQIGGGSIQPRPNYIANSSQDVQMQNPQSYGYYPQRSEETQQRYETQQQMNANATGSVTP